MGKQTMININLTPIEELDNPLWYLPDATAFGLVFLISFFSVSFYLNEQEAQVETLRQEIANHEAGIDQVQGEVSQFNDLNEKITKLESKKSSLLRITDSKLLRYLPVILVENLQNLKPQGLWFTRVAFVTPDPNAQAGVDQANQGGVDQANQGGVDQGQNPNPVQSPTSDITISIEGSAFNKIIIAEFMTALKATQNQEFNSKDVRTQLFFDTVDISFAETASIEGQGDEGVEVSDFKLILSFKERKPGDQIDAKLTSFINNIKNSKAMR